MAGKKNEVPETAEKAVVNEVAAQPEKMEFRLINPTEDGFLRVIKWNREELEAAVRQKIASYENVVYTEDNMKQAKADRAELNKLTKAIEERRKMVKKIINEPYDIFEAELKEILALIQEPVGIIDKQVKAFEEQQKDEKKKSIREAYDENIGDLLSVLPFEKVFDERYLNKTYKLNTAVTEIKDKIEGVKRDLDTIDSLDSKYKLNVKDYYLKALDLSKAMAENKRLLELEEKLEAEKKRKEEAEKKRLEEEAKKKEQAGQSAAASYFRMANTASGAGQDKKNVPEETESVPDSAESVHGIAQNVPKADENKQNPVENEQKDLGNVSGQAVDPFASKPAAVEKKYRAKFYAIGTREQLNKLREYMEVNGIQYGKVE